MIKKGILWAAVFLFVAAGVLFFYLKARPVSLKNSAPPVVVDYTKPATYAGSETCQSCHVTAYEAWQGSHHQQAMQHATPTTIVGDFNDRHFIYGQIESVFYTRDNKFYVKTDGPDGQLAEFEILFTFGVEPLQQYLVALDGGRLQALSIAWDNRTVTEGGQRWFHLYPEETIDYQDELHWTRLSQNWNYMCAECHSTHLEKGYDVKTDQFNTTWSEISVGCEACHGPASRHIDWAQHKPGWETVKAYGLDIQFNERRNVTWNRQNTQTTAQRNQPRTTDIEIETCARCHSRRSLLNEDYQQGQPLMNTHLPALLTNPLYYPDGQIKAEDYVYGSFLQSKMYHQGVTCSDCHEPHSLQLREPGNGVCFQCHQEEHYATREHHLHDPQAKGGLCAECHMPAQNYMVIDARHDHSFRIPRPDLSLQIHVPNACTQCHEGQSDAWAADVISKGYRQADSELDWHFGQTLFDAHQGKPGVQQDLLAVAAAKYLPAIARATAASLLSEPQNPYLQAVLPSLLQEDSAWIRRAALSVVDQMPVNERWHYAGHLLRDPILAVRIEAARVLAPVMQHVLDSGQRRDLQRAITEYIKAQKTNAEHPQSWVNTGLIYLRSAQFNFAEEAYLKAIQQDKYHAAAYVNLADLYRLQNKDNEAERILLEANTLLSGDASLQHALGLLYIRHQKNLQALSALSQAVALMPDNRRYRYVYAVALESAGQMEKAIEQLQQLQKQYPHDSEVLLALVTYTQRAGLNHDAKLYADQLLKINPQFGAVDQILQHFK